MTASSSELLPRCTSALAAAEALGGVARRALSTQVTRNGAVDAAALEREQFAAHAYAWLATYVEALRQTLVRKAPKWGNDDDYVDQIHVRCHRDVAKHSWEIKDPTGNPWPPLPENIAAYVTNATKVWALPNGRRLGDTLYDGGCSPGAGMDKKGPTAVLRSVAKIDHIGDVRATLLNQRLSPQQLAGEKGFNVWYSYIKTWAELGIDHVQFNMVDNETLKAAQKERERLEKERQERIAALQQVAKRLSGTEITIAAAANEEGHLYGSVSARDIVHKLGEIGYPDLQPSQVRMEHALRQVGEHAVNMHLGENVDAEIKVIVTKAEQAAEQAEDETADEQSEEEGE